MIKPDCAETRSLRASGFAFWRRLIPETPRPTRLRQGYGGQVWPGPQPSQLRCYGGQGKGGMMLPFDFAQGGEPVEPLGKGELAALYLAEVYAPWRAGRGSV